MALIEAAFSLASSSSYSLRSSLSLIRSSSPFSSPSLLHKNALPIKSFTVLSKRNLSNGSGSHYPDIEESPPNVHDSFLRRFRTKRGLSVTDLTSTEWCEKQMEFSLQLGGREMNKIMRAGIERHAKLEQEVPPLPGSGYIPTKTSDQDKRIEIKSPEVITRVEVEIKSREDWWALKFLNFINGVNQLLFEGLTRELPVMGIAEGIWIVGVIDEIQMPLTGNDKNPFLIDTKTRSRDKLPSEPQRRNGRLQLMCYKYLWDSLVSDDFPSKKFFSFFGLNPQHILCEDLEELSDDSGIYALTLDDVVRCYGDTCKMLGPAHDQLLLRYEYQKDYSLLGEDKFAYDSDWLKNQIRHSLEFWHGEREASYASAEERWKCRFCQYATVCPR